jgi:hypothetical protein
MICPICGSERIHLSRLRVSDLPRLLMFCYPVRCGECFERGSVNLIEAFRISQHIRARKRAHKGRNAAPHHTPGNGA